MDQKWLLLKSSDFKYNSKSLKKPALLWALQFQFNYGIYPIVQLLSLKLPMESQCIQVSSLKSISFPNVMRDSIFTLPGKVPLWQNCQNDVLCGNMNMDISPYILKFKFFYKNTCSTMTAWFLLVYCTQIVKWYTFTNRPV